MTQVNSFVLVSGSPVDHLSVSSPAGWWAWIWAHIAPYLPPAWVWWIVGALCALALTVVLGRAALRAGRKGCATAKAYVSGRPVEDLLTVVAASIATGVSATGMWRFSEDVLHLPFILRVLLFAFIEVAIITSAVRARRNMRENFSAGIDGIAVWALTCLTAVLSSMDARSLPEALFRLAAPLVAAWLWERGMAIERHRIRGTGRINWRLTPERVMVRIGLAEASDRTAGDVDAHRRLTRLALAAKRARTMEESGASDRKKRGALAKLDKAMDQAVEHTGLTVDPVRQKALLAAIDSLYSTRVLVDRRKVARWADPVTERQRADAISAIEQEQRFDSAEALQRAMDRTAVTLMALTERTADFATADVTPDVTSEQVTWKVTNPVTDKVAFEPASAPAVTARVTPPATDLVTVEQVTGHVTFDVTDPDAYVLERALSATPYVTLVVTPPATTNVTDDEVTSDVTEETEDASKTQVMREYWDREVTQDRYPTVAELTEHAKVHHSLASRARKKWVKELPWWQRRKAEPKREKTSA